MPEVQVIFPAATGDTTTVAKVLPPTVVTSQHQRVTWSIYNCDNRIHYVDIKFETKEPDVESNALFPNENTYGKAIEGKSDIYLDIPDLQKERPVLLKYTVRGWRSEADVGSGDPVSELDPEILVNEP